MFCTECGASLDDAAKFCSQCGTKLKPAEKNGAECGEAAAGAGEKPVEKGSSGSFHLPVKIEDTMEAKSAAISSNGEYLAVNTEQESQTAKLRVLETKTGEAVYSMEENPDNISGNADAVCSAGQYISMLSASRGRRRHTSMMAMFSASASASEEGRRHLEVLDTKTGTVTVKLSDSIHRSIFSPDSKYLAVTFALSDRIIIYNVQKGNKVFTFKGYRRGNSIKDLAYSPDSNYLVAVSDETIRLWDANSGERIYAMDTNNESIGALFNIAFRPDGERFATLSTKGGIAVWDAKSGSLLLQFSRSDTRKYNDKSKTSICFAPDGKSIIAGFSDGVIIIYNAETGEVLKKLSGNKGGIEWAAYTPDSKKFIACTGGMVKFWSCE